MDNLGLVAIVVLVIVAVLYIAKGKCGDRGQTDDGPKPPESKSTGNEQDAFRAPKS